MNVILMLFGPGTRCTRALKCESIISLEILALDTCDRKR